MGLTHTSTGKGAVDTGLSLRKKHPNDRIVALAGNPNVGKSTLFNALTGMNQHTGNWAGKTVSNAQGYCRRGNQGYVLVDLPGTYSLMAHSAEEEVARNFLCFGQPDAAVVVCDATCLERSLNLVLQTMELIPRVVVCVNLMDEARHKGIQVDLHKLSQRLGVPVVGTVARKKRTLDGLLQALHDVEKIEADREVVHYPKRLEEAIADLVEKFPKEWTEKLNGRWLAIKLLEGDKKLLEEIGTYLEENILENEIWKVTVEKERKELSRWGFGEERFRDILTSSLVQTAERLCRGVVTEKSGYSQTDRRLDKIFTSKRTGYPVMAALLMLILWLTIVGANYPSELLSKILFWGQEQLSILFSHFHTPDWLHGILVLGGYRTLAWVASVMLPPMAIFFPLFTLLEDSGYLPRIAYNLDRPFKMCGACGKQALTMCMGFGCNAAGIVGCRIIDSPRERLLAVLTNSFVPCNGRFPTLIAMLTMFFVGAEGDWKSGILSAFFLTGIILLGIGATFGATKVLSATLLRGELSSFTLELPPYRKPQVGRVILRSIFDRTLFALGRAVAVAAPAGILLWVLANVTAGDKTLLAHCAAWMEPFARLMGLDGVILMAFILGFPANEIVIPIILMAYLAQGSLMEMNGLWEMKEVLIQNGWTWKTAVNVMLFSLFHWPCSTTLLTIHKETGSWKWTALAAIFPTVLGVMACVAVAKVLGV